jgi:hypothetical protein
MSLSCSLKQQQVLQKKIETLNGHIAKWIKAKEKEKKGGF